MARLPRLLLPLARPRFALLIGGLAFSAIGDQLYLVVLTWVAVDLLGPSAGYLAALKAALVLLTALGAGAWIDLVPYRRALIGADVSRAAALICVVVPWLLTGRPSAGLLVLSVVVLAVGEATFKPAIRALLPYLAGDRDKLPAANALLDSTERIARLLGPGLIAVLVVVLPPVHFLTVDTLSFAGSAIAVLAGTRALSRVGVGQHRSAAGRLAESARGFRAIARHPLLFAVFVGSGITNGAWYGALFLAVPILLAGTEGAGSGGLGAYGAVIASYGATNLVSMLIVGGSGPVRRPARMIFAGDFVVGGGIALMGAAALAGPPAALLVPLLCAGAALAAPGGPMSDIPVAYLQQTELPQADIAAAVRAFMVMSNAGLLAGMAAMPQLVAHAGAGATIILCGVACIAIGVLGIAVLVMLRSTRTSTPR